MKTGILQQILITSITVIVLVVLTLAIYYFATRKNVKKQRKHFENLHKNLQKGQYIEFSNGIVGKLREVGMEYCDVEIKSGAILTVSRYAISRIIEGNELEE